MMYAHNHEADYERYIHVNVFNEKDNKLVPTIRHSLAQEIVNFQFAIQSFPDIEVVINVAQDKNMYDKWVTSYNRVFHNSLAFTDLNRREIYIKNPANIGDMRKTIRVLLHEYIHLYIHHHFVDAPLWFHEGMATFYADNISLNQTFSYVRNNVFHQEYLLPKYQYRYPSQRGNIEPYYFQSALLVRKIVEDKKNKLRHLFEVAPEVHSFDEAFLVAFAQSPVTFLHNFKKDMDDFFKMNIYIGIMILSWSLFPIFLIIAKIKQTRRTKRLLDEWEQEIELSDDIICDSAQPSGSVPPK
jgi:hypothetical protein